MKPANPRALTINGRAPYIRIALFEAGDLLQWILEGGISAEYNRVPVDPNHTDEDWIIANAVCRVFGIA
jgi:hypothetical protein